MSIHGRTYLYEYCFISEKKKSKACLARQDFLGLYIVSETQRNWQWELFETIILQHRHTIFEIIHNITFVILSKHDRYLLLILTILKYQKWDRAYCFVKAFAGRVSEVGGVTYPTWHFH